MGATEMLDYSNYLRGIPSTSAKITSGVNTALGLRQGQMAVQAAQYKQQLLEQEQQTAQAMQTDLAALASKPDRSPQDFLDMMARYPAMSDHFKTSYDVLSSEQQEVSRGEAMSLYAALDAGEPEVAKQKLENRIKAAENSGEIQEVGAMKAMLQLINTNPEFAKTSAGLMLANSMGEDEFANVFTKLRTDERKKELQPGAVRQAAADLDLTNAEISKVMAHTDKLNAESQKAVMELEALEKSGGVDPEKKFNQEEKLRKEYTARTKSFSESERNMSNIKSSASDGTGPGDVALITSFMKMLDPGSVVRETEFATARDTAGLFTTLTNTAKKLHGGQLLSPAQRKTFTNLAQKYFNAAKAQETKVRRDLGKVVKNYSLEEENVFGLVEEMGQPVATGGQEATTRAEAGGVDSDDITPQAGTDLVNKWLKK